MLQLHPLMEFHHQVGIQEYYYQDICRLYLRGNISILIHIYIYIYATVNLQTADIFLYFWYFLRGSLFLSG